jgi:cobalt-zinc-cadmium efflux system outer membrane protein
MILVCFSVSSCLVISGCKVTTYCDQKCQVNSKLTQNMGASLGPSMCPDETAIPPSVDLSDGLSEEEAVATALWNNAAYLEMLSQLGLSRAQLLDAGLLTDPEMTIFFPLGPKQLEFAFFQSISAIWLRPVRMRAAELDLIQLSEQMVQNGLNVIRDVRSAHAQLLLAQSRVELAEQTLTLQTGIADLAQKRLDAGDISELESMNSQVDAFQSTADLARFQKDQEIAREQLRVLLGITMHEDSLTAVGSEERVTTTDSTEDLLAQALAMRPDLRAAELQIEAACERLELSELQFMNLDAIYDANGQGRNGFESGPGLRLTIPIFNRNQGGIAIADAQLQQALRRYITVRDQVVLDVRNAHLQYQQAHENLKMIQEMVLPTLEESVKLSKKSFQDGDSNYFIVLITTQRFVVAKTQELQLEADLRRSLAELDRSVGHRVSAPASTTDIYENSDSPKLLPAPAPVEIVTISFVESDK